MISNWDILSKISKIRRNRKNYALSILVLMITALLFMLIANYEDSSIKDDSILTIHESNACQSASWSPDDNRFVSCSNDTTFKIWDSETGEESQSFIHPGVQSVTWSPDGTKIVSGSFDKTIKIWNLLNNQTLLISAPHNGSMKSLYWSPDGSKLASRELDSLIIWNTNNWSIELIIEYPFSRISWSPDNTKIATIVGGNVTIIDVSTGIIFRSLKKQGANSISWGPYNDVVAFGFSSSIVKWNISDGSEVHILTERTSVVWSIAWSPNGKQFASGNSNDRIIIYDSITGSIQKTFAAHNFVLTITWKPDGTRIASGSSQYFLKIWDTSNLPQVETIDDESLVNKIFNITRPIIRYLGILFIILSIIFLFDFLFSLFWINKFDDISCMSCGAISDLDDDLCRSCGEKLYLKIAYVRIAQQAIVVNQILITFSILGILFSLFLPVYTFKCIWGLDTYRILDAPQILLFLIPSLLLGFIIIFKKQTLDRNLPTLHFWFTILSIFGLLVANPFYIRIDDCRDSDLEFGYYVFMLSLIPNLLAVIYNMVKGVNLQILLD